jgi:hypothetical protein
MNCAAEIMTGCENPWFKTEEVVESSSKIQMAVIWEFCYVRDRVRDHFNRLCGGELWPGTGFQAVHSASPVQTEKRWNCSV